MSLLNIRVLSIRCMVGDAAAQETRIENTVAPSAVLSRAYTSTTPHPRAPFGLSTSDLPEEGTMQTQDTHPKFVPAMSGQLSFCESRPIA